eukprot:scaffold2686_cov176-Isochrysis_galbana.AAC.3
MGEGRGSVRTAEGQRCPAMSPLRYVMGIGKTDGVITCIAYMAYRREYVYVAVYPTSTSSMCVRLSVAVRCV